MARIAPIFAFLAITLSWVGFASEAQAGGARIPADVRAKVRAVEADVAAYARSIDSLRKLAQSAIRRGDLRSASSLMAKFTKNVVTLSKMRSRIARIHRDLNRKYSAPARRVTQTPRSTRRAAPTRSRPTSRSMPRRTPRSAKPAVSFADDDLESAGLTTLASAPKQTTRRRATKRVKPASVQRVTVKRAAPRRAPRRAAVPPNGGC